MKLGTCITVLTLAALGAMGCGSDEEDDGGSTIDSATGGYSGVGTGGTGASLVTDENPEGSTQVDGTDACSFCMETEACLVVTVTRGADTSAQPWVLWPTEADGSGNLYATLERAGYQWRLVTSADLAAETGPFELDACIEAGNATLNVYLDDDGDSSDVLFSSDYLDSCGEPRARGVVLRAGTTLTVPYELTNSCD